MDKLSRRDFLAVSVAAGSSLACATARQAPASVNERSVVVLGAGLSGLVSAMELAAKGFDVRVLESRAEPGGRIRTIRAPFPEGLFVEAGAAHVVGDPDLMALFQSVNVEVYRPNRPPPLSQVSFRAGVRKVLAPDAVEPESGPPLNAEEQALPFPDRIDRYFKVTGTDPRKLDWTAALQPIDKLDANQFLVEKGASEGYRRFIEDALCPGRNLKAMGALALAREVANIKMEIAWGGGGRVVGGTDALPRAIAAKLGERVTYGAHVVRVEQNAGSVTVTFTRNGATEKLAARHAVCALPGPVVGAVAMVPALPEDHLKALSELNIAPVARIFVGTRTRFWAQRGENGTAETDLLVGKVRDETMLQNGPAGVIGTYVTGPDARRVGSMSEEERIRSVVEDFERVHPGFREQMTTTASLIWHEDPLFRGAYNWLSAGQMTTQLPVLRRPHGAVHFAGDYNSHRPGFMHGALASAKRAVAEIAG